MKFDSPLLFAQFLLRQSVDVVKDLHAGLEKAGEMITNQAKSEIGKLQPSIGSPQVAQEWEPLAPRTRKEKERLGYGSSANDWQPLLRTGELRDSIHYEVNKSKLEVIVGSDSPIAAYQEFGTSRIPPRPFIGRAAFILTPKIANMFAGATIRGVMGGEQMSPIMGSVLGYSIDISAD